MLPESSRAQLVKNFGETAAKSLEDVLQRISDLADKAGIEKKEKKDSKQIDSLVTEFTNLVVKAVEKQESEVSTKQNEDSPFLKELKSKLNFNFTTKTKAATPSAPADDPIIAAFKSATTKASIGLVDGIFQLNQHYANGSKRQ